MGDRFTFEIAAGPKGYHAVNIQKSRGNGNVGTKQVVGTLKRIHGGNGFCSVEGVDGDVLLGSRSLQDGGINLEAMQIGDNLTFELARGPKGYNAINIQESLVGKRVVGKLKKIHGKNGFCSVEGLADDVLLGSRTLGDCGLDLATMKVGDAFSFEMVFGSKGYCATDIQRE